MIVSRKKDKRSVRASLESTGPAARKVVEAVAGSTADLQAVMNRDPRYPADPREVLAAVVAFRRAQTDIDLALAELLAWLEVGGVARGTISRALGIRPATLQKMLAPAELIASARCVDLHRGDDGAWAVRRLTRLPEIDGEDGAA